jgi:hypothetical protein
VRKLVIGSEPWTAAFYTVTFRWGRRRGAIGIFYPMRVSVYARSAEDAIATAREHYESGGPAPVAVQDYICPDGPPCPDAGCAENRKLAGLWPTEGEPVLSQEVEE